MCQVVFACPGLPTSRRPEVYVAACPVQCSPAPWCQQSGGEATPNSSCLQGLAAAFFHVDQRDDGKAYKEEHQQADNGQPRAAGKHHNQPEEERSQKTGGLSGEVEELADLLEITYAVANAMGTSEDQLNNIRRQKLDKRGGFNKKIILERS